MLTVCASSKAPMGSGVCPYELCTLYTTMTMMEPISCHYRASYEKAREATRSWPPPQTECWSHEVDSSCILHPLPYLLRPYLFTYLRTCGLVAGMLVNPQRVQLDTIMDIIICISSKRGYTTMNLIPSQTIDDKCRKDYRNRIITYEEGPRVEQGAGAADKNSDPSV